MHASSRVKALTRHKVSLIVSFSMTALLSWHCLPTQAENGEHAKDSAETRRPKIDLKFSAGDRSTTGEKTVAVDEKALVKILRSKRSNPNQASLDKVLQNTNRVRIFAGGEENGKPLTKKVLADTKDPVLLQKLKDCLRIDDESEILGRDMCTGDPTIELMSGNKSLAVLGFHHARAVRWSKKWKFDGSLKDGRQFVDWFADNGVNEPKTEFDAALKESRKSSADVKKWSMAMPECLRPFWGEVVKPGMQDLLIFVPEPSPSDQLRSPEASVTNSDSRKSMMSALDAYFPKKKDKILALLQWYASGIGKWTGFPSYEELPADLLLMLPTNSIIEALSDNDVSDPEMEGGARFFASHTVRMTKPQDLSLLDAHLKQRLLDHCLKSDDEDKRARAKKCFATADSLQSADNLE